tara:strand:+ start:16676 stop:17815 length:1140 start_codon:yes stop_codon:yes gene_type:complete
MKDITLGLFFTKGVSLARWKNSGLLDREKTIYEYMLEKGSLKKVVWFTYGVDDQKIAEELIKQNKLNKNIRVIGIPKILSGRIGEWIYSFTIFIIKRKTIKKIDILKSNQIYGSWAPVIVKIFSSKPFILRSGYVKSGHYGQNFFIKKLFKIIERISFYFADISVVSNQIDFDYVKKRYQVKNLKINPSFVDTSIFSSDKKNNLRENNRMIYVGRLADVKNINNTIDAVLMAGFSIDIYGDGILKNEIKRKYKTEIEKKTVRLMGVLPNSELAVKYRKYRFYILVSHVEGMSKTLMEAMASGLICIVSNIPQNRSLVKNGSTGILSDGFGANDIADTLLKINNHNLDEISLNAERYISKNFSLRQVSKNELNNIYSVLK